MSKKEQIERREKKRTALAYIRGVRQTATGIRKQQRLHLLCYGLIQLN